MTHFDALNFSEYRSEVWTSDKFLLILSLVMWQNLQDSELNFFLKL